MRLRGFDGLDYVRNGLPQLAKLGLVAAVATRAFQSFARMHKRQLDFVLMGHDLLLDDGDG